MRRALQGVSTKGRINRRGQLGINWRYAWQHPNVGGRTIVLASDRPITADQAIDQGIVSRDHNITLAVIELDEEGKGSGTLILGALLSIGADGRLEVTKTGAHGIHLGNVRVR